MVDPESEPADSLPPPHPPIPPLPAERAGPAPRAASCIGFWLWVTSALASLPAQVIALRQVLEVQGMLPESGG